MSFDAPGTGRFLLRRRPEDDDVAAPLDQLLNEGRRGATVGEKVDPASGPGHGDVEKAPLLGVRMFVRRRENEIEKGVVGDLRREPVSPRAQAEDHRIVGFEALGAVYGHEGQPQAGIAAGQAGQVGRLRVPVASQQQHARRLLARLGVRRDPVEGVAQQGKALGPGEPCVHARSVHRARRTHLLAYLRGVGENEPGRGLGDGLRTSEGRLQGDPLAGAKALPEVAHDGGVGSGEAEYRLPVVADGEQLGRRGLVEQCLQQPRPRGGDVLELIDQDVAEGAAVASRLHMFRRLVDHVVKVDLSETGESLLVGPEDRSEDGEERLGPPRVLGARRPAGDFLEGELGSLEVVKEGCQQAQERVDAALPLEDGEDLGLGKRGQGDAARGERVPQIAGQGAGGPFPAEGLDEDGALLGVKPALPLHVPEVLLLIDERRRPAFGVEAEVLDVEPRLREMEVGPVLTLLRGRRVVFVGGFVLVGHAVQVEEVGDLAFLHALHLLPLQGADVVAAEVLPVLPPVAELLVAPVGREAAHEPPEQGIRHLAGGEPSGEDLLQQVDERLVVLCGPGQ